MGGLVHIFFRSEVLHISHLASGAEPFEQLKASSDRINSRCSHSQRRAVPSAAERWCLRCWATSSACTPPFASFCHSGTETATSPKLHREPFLFVGVPSADPNFGPKPRIGCWVWGPSFGTAFQVGEELAHRLRSFGRAHCAGIGAVRWPRGVQSGAKNCRSHGLKESERMLINQKECELN